MSNEALGLPGVTVRSEEGRTIPRAGLNWILLAILLLAIAVPVLLVPVPALLDYPNHLARIWLLGGGVGQGPFPGIYQVEWQALTNIGVDLLAVPLTRVLPFVAVGQLFLYFGAALPVLGAVALNRTIFGGLSWWQIGFGFIAWHLTILAGFLNFNIGLGLALLASAADPWVLRRGTGAALVLRFVLAFALCLVHAFAIFFYAALLCGLALGAELRPLLTRSCLWERALATLRGAAPPIAALALIFMLTPALPGAHEVLVGPEASLSGWERATHETAKLLKLLSETQGWKLGTAIALVRTYWLRLDLLAVALVAAPALVALVRRRLRVHEGLLFVAAVLGVLFVLMPHWVLGTGWIDIRFAEMAGLILLLAMRPELPARWAPALAALMLAVGLARIGFVTAIWKEREADVQSVERALQRLPMGSVLLPLEHSAELLKSPRGRYFTDGFPAYGHLATLAVPWRHAFVPTVFTARGKQPLSLLPPWTEIAVPEGPVANAHALTDMQRFAGRYDVVAPYVAQWRERFDHVLLLNADVPDQYGPVRLPPELELVTDEGFARLYRIRRATP